MENQLPFVIPGFQEGSAEPQIARDDKKERVVARKGWLLDERAVTPQAFFKSNLDSSGSKME
jgi:hypothetical protein